MSMLMSLPGNRETLNFIKTTNSRIVAEIGVYEGYTSIPLAYYLGGQGELHLFDYEERVRNVVAKLKLAGYHNVVGHGNSHKTMDSYNWSLMRVLQQHSEPIYDYVYLDGAHTWNIDALAFFLIDRLLKIGGYIDFDDYNWSHKKSPTMHPKFCPTTAQMFTEEQIRESHVRLIVDLLVKRDRRYVPVRKNKIYQKIA